VNPKGHPTTLVPAHPRNKNALKAGVFSPATLAPRIAVLEAELGERPAEQVLVDLLRREIAALAVLGEAMDRSLEEDGLRGRQGEPRNLIQLRLRLNDRMRHTLEQFTVAAAARGRTDGDVSSTSEDVPEHVLDTVAAFHQKESIDQLQPADFDPEVFLRALVLTSDRLVRTKDRLRTRRILSRWGRKRADYCTCSATLKARDETELRAWVVELEEAGVRPTRDDAEIAAAVRKLASGDRLEPWSFYRRVHQAVEHVIRTGAEAASADAAPDKRDRGSRIDPALGYFWDILLSADGRIPVKERLDAFAALEEADAFPACTCRREDLWLAEDKYDASAAFVIRMVAQNHYRAAIYIARYPKTYVAVRDAIDDAILRARADDGNAAGRA